MRMLARQLGRAELGMGEDLVHGQDSVLGASGQGKRLSVALVYVANTDSMEAGSPTWGLKSLLGKLDRWLEPGQWPWDSRWEPSRRCTWRLKWLRPADGLGAKLGKWESGVGRFL